MVTFSNDLDGPLTRFSRSRHFLKSNIVKTAHLKDKVTIAQEETIPNIWNATVWWPWLTSKRVASVCLVYSDADFQCNQEPLVVVDTVRRSPGEFGKIKSMECNTFPSVLW